MKLTKARVEGYRSIREAVVFHLEPKVTVILGPNDHGKTNLISALMHLNADDSFEEDDLNWDSASRRDSLPAVLGTFSLSLAEREILLQQENLERKRLNQLLADAIAEDQSELEEVPSSINNEPVNTPVPPTGSTATAAPATNTPATGSAVDEEDEEDEEEDVLPDEPFDLLVLDDIPDELTISRVGLRSELECDASESFCSFALDQILTLVPRFELIDPITKLADSVSADELQPGKNDFMRGIFYYAGLDPDNSSELFQQTDRTQMQITRASEILNNTLKESWSQGKNLHFRLSHNSKDGRIDLQIEDPAVNSTYVRASRRSSGFTHYFSLKTILHARQKDHPADSYVLLFDEPGVFLHPSGQFDLIQVLETLANESQVVYVTHSLFMINKTFPTRHRLVMKTSSGTTVDGKPYVGRWQAVLSSLGLTLTGSILFANHVILSEGDSDPIYIYAMIQKAVSAGKANLDINTFSVLSTGESRHADVLLRLLVETNPMPQIAILTDGDGGGKDRMKYLKPMIEQHGIVEKTLTSQTSIEDHLPMLREVFIPSLANYVAKMMVLEGQAEPNIELLITDMTNSFDKDFDGKATKEVSKWAIETAMEIGKLTRKPSKVGIAREYATRLLELDNCEFKYDKRTKDFVEWVRKELKVPELHSTKAEILQR